MRVFLAALLFVASASLAPTAPAAGAAWPELDAARRVGWSVADALAGAMAKAELGQFGGVEAWLKAYRAIDAGTRGRGGPGVPAFDPDRLVARHPEFWRACYEIVPGDTVFMLLHAGLLLAGGEAARARQIVLLARQRADLPPELAEPLATLLQHALAVLDRADREVAAAIKQHEAGRPDAAAAALRAMLQQWPQSARAHFELGLALAAVQYRSAAGSVPPRKWLELHLGDKPPATALQALEQARRHDPLMVVAYQGPRIHDALVAIGTKARPVWAEVEKDLAGQVPIPELDALADALLAAGANELALVARQVVVMREGGYDDRDRRFVAAGLRPLVPAPTVQAIVQRLADAKAAYLDLVVAR